MSLADNRLTNITRDMFKGLDSLEHLYLQNNQIKFIDWAAFTHLKNLKVDPVFSLLQLLSLFRC